MVRGRRTVNCSVIRIYYTDISHNSWKQSLQPVNVTLLTVFTIL